MPELPEVETVRRGLRKQIIAKKIDKVILSDKKLRIEYPKNIAKTLKSCQITDIGRRSKYLLIGLDNGAVLVMHLGMSGKILFKEKAVSKFDRHDHFIVNFTDGSQIIFNDPRRFGLVTLVTDKEMQKHRLFKGLGIEPLSKGFNGEYLKDIFKNKAQPVKLSVMNASNLVGVGNIYASEALFRAGIDPQKHSGKISLPKLQELAQNIKTVLKEAIISGGSTLRDYVRSDGDVGYFQHNFRVYGREKEPCVSCGISIKRIVQQGRSTFFCPKCQK